jgi:hypothetical protein
MTGSLDGAGSWTVNVVATEPALELRLPSFAVALTEYVAPLANLPAGTVTEAVPLFATVADVPLHTALPVDAFVTVKVALTLPPSGSVTVADSLGVREVAMPEDAGEIVGLPGVFG